MLTETSVLHDYISTLTTGILETLRQATDYILIFVVVVVLQNKRTDKQLQRKSERQMKL